MIKSRLEMLIGHQEYLIKQFIPISSNTDRSKLLEKLIAENGKRIDKEMEE